MDDPNIPMEEYIRLEEEKAQKHGRMFNWKTATFGKVRHYDEEECFTNFKAEFPTIIFGNINDVSSQSFCNFMKKDRGDKCKNRNHTINWFGYKTTFEKEFEEFCRNNSKEEVGNGISYDCWMNYSPHDEWMLMKSEETDPTKVYQENIKDYKLIITKDELMNYVTLKDDCNEVTTKRRKLEGIPQHMIRKFRNKFDE
ncbi:hypothetical protein Tco_0446721 [Tanacetum coccineum]